VNGTPTLALAVLIVLVFVSRVLRTRQLYLTSLASHMTGVKAQRFNPRDPRLVLEQALLGRRSIEPKSFYIRGVVLAAVALCLLPFKGYGPTLWWLVVGLVVLYVAWCVAHGIMLKNRMRAGLSI
jgi:hypothetical protein